MGELTLSGTSYSLPGQTNFQKGSVRDIYTINDQYLAMVVTDRISAFDHILPVCIPYKGQVLSKIASYFLQTTSDIIPNWFIASPHPNVVLGNKCKPYPIEMVIRGYLAGHSWREYKAGKRELCGVKLPDGLQEYDKFPEPIITPATHAESGHDEDISAAQIVTQGIIPKKDYDAIESYTRKLYQRGSEVAAERGLVLIDTKYEFGKLGDQLVLMDEVHTPDSSRYFYKDSYEEYLKDQNSTPRHLSKEFVREWLMESGFSGDAGQQIPDMDDKLITSISDRYIELHDQLTGQKFKKTAYGNIANNIEESIVQTLERLTI